MPLLREAGHDVTGMTRSAEVARQLEAGGARAVVVDVFDADALKRAVVDARPDLVIVDVQMPYMNGYEFVQALKSDPATRNIPVVFLTVDERVVTESAQVGAAFLKKPVRVDEVGSIVFVDDAGSDT